MSIGVHVSRSVLPELHENIAWAMEKYGAKAFQIFTHGPYSLEETKLNVSKLRELTRGGVRLYVHSTYVVPWGKIGPIKMQLKVCDYIGASALIVHLPKLDPTSIANFIATINRAGYKTPIGLEMRAVKPDATSYESPTKLIALVNEIKKLHILPSRVFLCIDTAHIYAGGAQIRTSEEAKKYINELKTIEHYVGLLHLNGNQYDVKERSGDKHCTPLDIMDKIWGGLTYKESGCKVFVDWFLERNQDIILEQDMTSKATLLFKAS